MHEITRRARMICAAGAAAATAGLGVTPALAASAGPVPSGVPSRSWQDIPHRAQLALAAPAPTAYKVRRGDSLSSVARRQLGSARLWPELWWANRHHIANPNLVRAGQRLVLPARRRAVPSWLLAAADRAVPRPRVVLVTYRAPAPEPAAPAYQAPAYQATVSTSGMGSFQACVIARESGGNPSAVNPSSGAGGLYQFLPSTWAGLGYSGLPENASTATQTQAFDRLYAQAGRAPWASDGC